MQTKNIQKQLGTCSGWHLELIAQQNTLRIATIHIILS
jgi:hypothetical protein